MSRRAWQGGTALAAGLLWLGLAPGAGSRAQVGDRAAIDTGPPPAHWVIPPAPVQSPAESMRLMDLAPGFRIELVAAEPLVQDPIAFAFDARGRLWVLEWPSYNWPLRDLLPGLDSQPTPQSRLVVLSDTTGDGQMDRRTVFAEMDWPRGIQLTRDGVLVFALPEVVFLRDTDGDDRADSREVIRGGLPIPVNPHLAPSSPSWTLDNWTYGLQVEQRLRFTPGGHLTSPTGRLAGQWGMSHDDYGRLLFSYNQDHIRGSLVPTAYATRNPHYDATAGIDVRIGQDNEVWPHAITPGINRRAQLNDDGRLRVFTANAAPTVYRGDQFPTEFHGNVFVGESAGRLIRRSVLSEHDGIVTGRNAYEGREFLFSHDERFRPVYTVSGPDGALYVADMYRGIIEGHIFLTTFLRNQILDRGLHRPFHGMGRIYRIVHESQPLRTRSGPPPDEAEEWVAELGNPNGHWRDLAQRAIVDAGDASVAPAVRKVAVSHADPRARLQALWTLDGLGLVDALLVTALLKDTSPHVRMAALRLAEPRLEDEAVRRAVVAMTGAEEVAVRRQLMFTLGASQAGEAEQAMLQLLRRDVDVPFVVDAFVSGLARREPRILDALLASTDWNADRPSHRALVTALTTAITNAGDPAQVDDLLRLVTDAAGQPAWRRLAMLEGLAAARQTTFAPRAPAWSLLARVVEPELRPTAAKVVDRFATTTAPVTAGGAVSKPAASALIEQGRDAYAICAACHQADGRGLAALAPPLAGSAQVTGPAGALIDIVLRGRDVDPAYPSMPPLAGLSDDQLAAILSYVRQAWGNAAPPVDAAAVAARRAQAP